MTSRRGRQRTSTWVDMNRLRRVTLDINDEFLQAVPVTPKYPDKTLHIEKIYTDLSLRNNFLAHQRTYVSDAKLPDYGPINVPDDLFYNNNEQSRRIHIAAPAGYGKTVLCQYLVYCWCKAKKAQSPNDLSEWERGMGKFDFVFYLPMNRVDENRSTMQDMLRNDIFKDYPDCFDSIDEAFNSMDYCVLIMMDGLGAWKPTDDVRHYLRYRGIPDMEPSSRTSMLYTYRPYVSEHLRFDLDKNDKMIDIVGLCFDGQGILMEKILVNCFGVKEADVENDPKADMIRSISKHMKLKSLTNIPFFASAFIYSAYETSKVELSLANFIAMMVEFMIENARNRKEIGASIDSSSNRELEYDTKDFQAPKFVKEKADLNMCIYALSRIGKLTLKFWITKVTRHCIDRDKVSYNTGSAEKKFLLHSGMLNLTEGPVCFATVEHEITYVNRFVKEFCVALHVLCEKGTAFPKLMEHCATLENILEFANVFKIIAGIDPSVSTKLSKHIVDVLNSEADMGEYRQNFGNKSRRDTIRQAYELLSEVFWEAKNSTQKGKVDFHIEDVVLDGLSPVPVLMATSDLIAKGRKGVASLTISSVPDVLPGLTSVNLSSFIDGTSSLQSLRITDRKIENITQKFSSLSTLVLQFIRLSHEASGNLQAALKGCSTLRSVTLNSVLNDRSPLELVFKANKKLTKLALSYMFCKTVKIPTKHIEYLRIEQVPGSTTELLQSLPACGNLTTLHFSYTKNTVDTNMLMEALPALQSLRRVVYDGTLQGQSERQYHAAMVRTLLTLPNLESFEVRNTDIDNGALVLSSKMSHLTQIRLGCVKMTEDGWTAFVNSLLSIQLDASIVLMDTNIDDGNLERIDECNEVVMTVVEGTERVEFTKSPSRGGIFER